MPPKSGWAAAWRPRISCSVQCSVSRQAALARASENGRSLRSARHLSWLRAPAGARTSTGRGRAWPNRGSRVDLPWHCACCRARCLNGEAARTPPIRVLKIRAAPSAHVCVGAELKQAEVPGERLPKDWRAGPPSLRGPNPSRSVMAAQHSTAAGAGILWPKPSCDNNSNGVRLECKSSRDNLWGRRRNGAREACRALCGGEDKRVVAGPAAAAMRLASVSPRSPMHTTAKGNPSLCRSCFMESTSAFQNLGSRHCAVRLAHTFRAFYPLEAGSGQLPGV